MPLAGPRASVACAGAVGGAASRGQERNQAGSAAAVISQSSLRRPGRSRGRQRCEDEGDRAEAKHRSLELVAASPFLLWFYRKRLVRCRRPGKKTKRGPESGGQALAVCERTRCVADREQARPKTEIICCEHGGQHFIETKQSRRHTRPIVVFSLDPSLGARSCS